MNVQRPVAVEPFRVRLNVEQFQLLDRSGSFRDHAKTELLDGTIYAMNAQFRAHARAKGQLFRAFDKALAAAGSTLEVLSEVSVAMPPHGMPEPDLVVTSEAAGDGPVPVASIVVIVEVSDTTLDHDLGVKAAIYAAGEVSEYWVVDLKGRVLHQMWSPGADGYGERREVALGERVKAVTFDGLAVDTSDV
ncbi:MAG TPA: Uma2 family endonuclease [Sphingomonadaceae bacterium]|jgi:Uma2 family endonuclease|nr:Uma2 family endonuclease [Sphingomonadaceae bacterium]